MEHPGSLQQHHWLTGCSLQKYLSLSSFFFECFTLFGNQYQSGSVSVHSYVQNRSGDLKLVWPHKKSWEFLWSLSSYVLSLFGNHCGIVRLYRVFTRKWHPQLPSSIWVVLCSTVFWVMSMKRADSCCPEDFKLTLFSQNAVSANDNAVRFPNPGVTILHSRAIIKVSPQCNCTARELSRRWALLTRAAESTNFMRLRLRLPPVWNNRLRLQLRLRFVSGLTWCIRS